MKKILIIVSLVVIGICAVVFRFNIIGFYHEYLKDETLDLGGYGIEKVKDIEVDENGTLYVLSVSIASYLDMYDFVKYKEVFLVTKINDKHKVISSKMIDNNEIQHIEEKQAVDGDLMLLDGQVLALLEYMDYSGDIWEEKYYVYSFADDLLTSEHQEISNLVDRPLLRISNDQNHILIFEKDGSYLYKLNNYLTFY